jgi:hypothetical protein
LIIDSQHEEDIFLCNACLQKKCGELHALSDGYSTGMGTGAGMWEMCSEALDGEKLPVSLNKAIYALCERKAFVIEVK